METGPKDEDVSFPVAVGTLKEVTHALGTIHGWEHVAEGLIWKMEEQPVLWGILLHDKNYNPMWLRPICLYCGGTTCCVLGSPTSSTRCRGTGCTQNSEGDPGWVVVRAQDVETVAGNFAAVKKKTIRLIHLSDKFCKTDPEKSDQYFEEVGNVHNEFECGVAERGRTARGYELLWSLDVKQKWNDLLSHFMEQEGWG